MFAVCASIAVNQGAGLWCAKPVEQTPTQHAFTAPAFAGYYQDATAAHLALAGEKLNHQVLGGFLRMTV